MTDKDFKTNIKTFSNKELLEQMDFMADGYYSDLVEVCLEELGCRLEATKWHYPSRGELPEKREIPYQCFCKIHAVGEDENVFYAALWFDGSHFYMPDIDNLYWEENDYTNITICWQYIIPPKEEG